MAAAYAALVSLMHTIQHLQNHPRPPISLDKSQVESLTENIDFFLDFLEGCSHGVQDSDGVEICIKDAAHAAEDMIESHIVDQILEEARTIVDLYKGLQGSIEYMDFIKKEVKDIKEKALFKEHLHRHSTSRSSFPRQSTMVGFDDELIEIMDKLTGQQSDRKIIPIVGMGGIGKTTLVKNVYSNPFIQHHFDIYAWATISQEHSTPEILKEVLNQVNEGGRGDESGDESELGVTLHKHLTRRRYLIVMDDLWTIEAWDKINLFFPDNDNGSRIIITTRQSNLASQVTDFYRLHMKFLDVDKSWNLFCKVVFGEDDCPLDLEEMGKKIARGCRGLPLSISVIGGLLSKSKCEREHWEYIAENLNSVVNLENNESCLNILHMSYSQLPAYLKPCFLFVGVFPGDHRIRVSMLIELWVAEGLVKPNSGKSLEETAGENFKSLIDRNLILVDELGSTGNIKYCKIHDLLRGVCLRQAQKERFYNVIEQHRLNVLQGPSTCRRLVLPEWPLSPEKKFRYALQSAPLARSFICHSCESPFPLLKFQLLRIWKTFDSRKYSTALGNMFDLVNMRYLDVRANGDSYLYSFYRLWNLHTLIVDHSGIIFAPAEIWKMPQLRRVQFNALVLPDPCMDGNDIVLENLHTLSRIKDFKCDEEIVKRIPNIKKLRTSYSIWHDVPCLVVGNLDRLQKLESLYVTFPYALPGVYRLLNFPQSLKKLTIECFDSKDHFFVAIGSLPFLEKLKLSKGSFHEHKWGTVERQFCSLKFLHIEECNDLEHWITDSAHFPRLERLVLYTLPALKEIPSEIGEIPTLESIHLKFCGGSVVESARTILDEQEELGNEGLRVRVLLGDDNPLRNLASRNFQVDFEF